MLHLIGRNKELFTEDIHQHEKQLKQIVFVTKFLVTDANIFMIRQRYSHKQVFELINKLENEGKIKNMNILVNDLKVSRYYGYNYGYNYGYGYGYGYRFSERKER